MFTVSRASFLVPFGSTTICVRPHCFRASSAHELPLSAGYSPSRCNSLNLTASSTCLAGWGACYAIALRRHGVLKACLQPVPTTAAFTMIHSVESTGKVYMVCSHVWNPVYQDAVYNSDVKIMLTPVAEHGATDKALSRNIDFWRRPQRSCSSGLLGAVTPAPAKLDSIIRLEEWKALDTDSVVQLWHGYAALMHLISSSTSCPSWS